MSRESRGAREVLVEIRSVINHLELQDSVLNQELKVWKSMRNSSDTENIQALLEKNLKLQEQLKQIGDYSSKQMQEISHLQDENTNLRESISAKDMEINKLKRDLTAQKNTCGNMSDYYVKMEKDLEKSQSDLRGTKEERDSYSSTCEDVIKKNNDLKQENEILKEEIAKLRSGGVAAGSSDLMSPDQPPARIAQRLNVTDKKADTSASNHEGEPPAPEGFGIMRRVATIGGNLLHAAGFGAGSTVEKSGDEGSDDSSDDGKAAAAGSHNGGPAARAAAGGARSNEVSPQYTVAAELTKDTIRDPAAPAAAASSKDIVRGQPVAVEAQEDSGNILDLRSEPEYKNTINALYNKLKVLPFVAIENNQSTSPATMVNRILNSKQYQPYLKLTAKKYNIDINLDDITKIDLLFKYFSEYKRLSEIGITDFNKACSKLRTLEKSLEENLSKQDMLKKFHTLNSQQRSLLSYCLFAVLNKQSVDTFAKTMSITAGSRKRDTIDKLIEIPSTKWEGFVSSDIDSITNK